METISRSVLTFLLNACWQIPVVTLAAMLACQLLRKGPASHRHAVWTAALAVAILLPLASVRTAAPQPGPRFEVFVETLPAAGAPDVAAAPSRAPAQTPPGSERRNVPLAQTTAGVLLAGYALFLLWRLARLAWAWMTTVQIRAAAAHATPPAVERVWMRCLAAFGLERVELLWSARVSSPITAGRTIVLPESLFSEGSEDVLATAIGHEMAHIARRDFALHVLSEVLYLPISFHPACWLIRREIERSREMACDELVIRKLMDPRAYAQSILSMAAAAAGMLRPGYTLGVFDGDILEARIRRMLERRVENLRRARLLLATGLATLGICALIASGLALTARAQGGSENELRLAAEAYNRGDFAGAVQRFENAVRLDPSNSNAKFFLANALMRQSYADGGGQPDNVLMLRAREQYREILARESRNKLAVEGMMGVSFATKRFDEAREWALKLIEVDPKEKAGYYMAGVVDWAEAYPAYQRAKQAAGQRPEEIFIADANARRRLRDEHLPRVEESLRMLETAIGLDPGYDDAMAYLNLSYRLKAGMVESAGESADLIRKADEWLAKALATRKQNAAARPGPSRLDVSGAPPGPVMGRGGISRVPAPPPPPPPPPPPRAEWENQAVSETAPSMARTSPVFRGPSWQVAGQTAMSAKTLLRSLSDRGFPAQPVISGPRPFQVRILVGPYIDPQKLEQAKLDLERAGFRPLRVW